MTKYLSSNSCNPCENAQVRVSRIFCSRAPPPAPRNREKYDRAPPVGGTRPGDAAHMPEAFTARRETAPPG